MSTESRIPLWIPVPGAPYTITSRGKLVLKSDVRQVNGRRIGGQVISLNRDGAALVIYPQPDGSRLKRLRSAKRLREEALEGWHGDR